MPLECKGGKVTYRVKQTKKGGVRLAFCKGRVIEAKKLGDKVKKKGELGGTN